MTQSDLVALFAAWAATFSQERDSLIALDGRVGDSDLGITMNKAFDAALEAATASANEPVDKMLRNAGLAIAKAAPSTMGTLTATGFLRGSKALEGSAEIGTTELARFWRAYADGVAERGKAKVGDKTVLDVLEPVARSCEDDVLDGLPMDQVLANASAVAHQALEATKFLRAQQGKAAAFDLQTVGLQDAGATVALILVRTWSEYLEAKPD